MKRPSALLVLALLVSSSIAADKADDAALLVRDLGPLWNCIAGQSSQFAITGHAELEIDGKPQRVEFAVTLFDEHSFDLELSHPEYSVQLRRRADATALALSKHKVVFVGRGDVIEGDHLAPAKILPRLVGPGSQVSAYLPLLQNPDTTALGGLLVGLLNVKCNDQGEWVIGKDTVKFDKEGRLIDVAHGKTRIHLEIASELPKPREVAEWPDHKQVVLPRTELEQTLARGVRRACEVLAPSSLLTSPKQQTATVPHGELRWIEGQRVALLSGTPEQIGQAHGELLKSESQRCMDSVLCAFGTVQTIRNGRWFRHDLEAAYARLSPHIPEDHKVETRALARSLAMDEKLVEALNVFPELFHCSGFAVYGKATKDGKLYHGRVLDYMTTIGLQDSATTFIVKVDGKIPFANVGYAGCIGSVSGMNGQAISLGEMGGAGEGKWDGVPMATLMRRALEECDTLDEVMALWKDSPRTCEYYYVFADGKTNRAVGVSATPEAIEFIQAGQSHERLGEGIENTVVLSAGDRLQKLRERVKEKYGQIDAEAGQWLMCRPVAMNSNLHNVLFVPSDGVLYVANADHKHPAAERPYAKLNLKELLSSMSVAKASGGR